MQTYSPSGLRAPYFLNFAGTEAYFSYLYLRTLIVVSNRPSKYNILQFLLVKIFLISGILAPMIIFVMDLDYPYVFYYYYYHHHCHIYQACKITIGLWNSERLSINFKWYLNQFPVYVITYKYLPPNNYVSYSVCVYLSIYV